MSSKYCEMDIMLNELTCKAEIMKESLQKSLLIKTKYIQLNEESRKRIQRYFMKLLFVKKVYVSYNAYVINIYSIDCIPLLNNLVIASIFTGC